MTTLLDPPIGTVPFGDEDDDARSGQAELPPPAPTAAPPEPRPPTPSRTSTGPFPLSIVFIVALVVVLGGLGAWAAMSNMGGQSTSSWEFVPASSDYSTTPPAKPAAPVIPASAHTTAAALPPMVETAPATAITLKIDSGPLGGTYGPNGQVVDDFSPAFFTVPAGKKITVTVYNYDTAWHTFAAPGLGLNVWFTPHISASQPSKTTFTFTAPRVGYYQWFCATPCDPFSMATSGYMQGDVHATKA